MPDARLWHRHSSRERLARFALSLAVLAAVMVSIRSVEVIPEFLLDAPEQVQDLLVRMWPINFGFYPDGVHDALVDTLHIATLGTLIAIALALPVGVLSARTLVRSRLINLAARLILVATRSVNSLIWALLFVAIFGPGALAGTLAIACRSIGFVGKLIGEALEEAEPGADRGLACGRCALVIGTVARLLATACAHLLVGAAAALGYQHSGILCVGSGWRRGHRHGARYRAQPVSVDPRVAHSAVDLCDRDRSRNHRHANS